MMPPEVTVYTTQFCGYCFAAKRLLGKRGIAYLEVDVTGDAPKRAWLVDATKRRTVPQIFIGDASIGGYEELRAMDQSGELVQRMGEPDPQPPVR
jgi:glutaredoxin 3